MTLSVDGKPNGRTVHRMVARAFIPNPENNDEVDHIDRNRVHNHVLNLRWVTHSENNINKAGRSNTGIKHISRVHSRGVFQVSLYRGGKDLFRKCFLIKDRDEAEVLAEALAYRNEKYEEHGIQVDDREADGGTGREPPGC